jgi:heme/copper-type cytochrome/quinol oxidase subunit 2
VRTLRRVQPAEAALLWFGVFGAALAWMGQHIVGWMLTEAQCGDRARGEMNVNLDTWTLVIGLTAAVVAIAAGVAAVLTWRATRGLDDSDPPPRGRIHFLAVIGMTITPLFLAMILMSSFGVLSLDPCRQS